MSSKRSINREKNGSLHTLGAIPPKVCLGNTA